MCLHSDNINGEYAKWLGQLSYDSFLNEQMSLPSSISQMQDIHNLYEAVYPQAQLYKAHENSDLFRLQGILTPFNKVDIDMNANLLERMYNPTLPEYSTESLQNIQLAGMPLSKLALKIGAPVMLLRNLDQPNGLNNGSHMIIARVLRRCLEGRLLGGDHDGELRIIPRIPLTSLEGELPFILTWRQFPVKLCFAMTINKSQGQSLKTVGLDLRVPMFSHGQLYVALSRVTDVSNLTVLLPEQANSNTTNIVYPEVLEFMREDR